MALTSPPDFGENPYELDEIFRWYGSEKMVPLPIPKTRWNGLLEEATEDCSA